MTAASAARPTSSSSERSRIYGDLWFRDVFRVFVEYGYVETSNEELPPSATDIDKDDLINLFADLKLLELNDHPAYLRTGRQELDYGSQRLISQTDFPNAPRIALTGSKPSATATSWTWTPS